MQKKNLGKATLISCPSSLSCCSNTKICLVHDASVTIFRSRSKVVTGCDLRMKT